MKQGIRDADYPDMPLGGWAGTISEVHDNGMYTVRWSQETLAAAERHGGDHEYLAKNLVFPVRSRYTSETGPFSSKR